MPASPCPRPTADAPRKEPAAVASSVVTSDTSVIKVLRRPVESALGSGIGVVHQAGQVIDAVLAPVPEGVLKGVDDEFGGHPGGGAPAAIIRENTSMMRAT